jgi:hypothetical protein
LGARAEANAEEQIGVVLPQLLVHERDWDRFGWLVAKQGGDISRQMFAQERPGKLRVAQGLLEESIVNVNKWLRHVACG